MGFNPVNSIVKSLLLSRYGNMKKYLSNPVKTQFDLLNRMVKTAKGSSFGKKYYFKRIKTYEDFKSEVPLFQYEDFVPYVEKMRKGKQNVTWPTMIKWFSKSSGTTDSKSKFLPTSYESIDENHLKGGRDFLTYYCRYRPDTTLFTGKSLRLGGNTEANSTSHESYFGDVSAIIIENLPMWIELRSTPNQRIALMDEWEEKIERIAQTTMDKNVTSLVGVPSWMLILIKKVIEKKGASNLLEVWPNLELYVHGGVSFKPYSEEFKKLIPDPNFTYLETYNATEGFFAVQDQFPSKGMLLLINHGIFYEFIPLDQYNGVDSEAICLDKVELNTTYVLVISTISGVWRYIIGDTVKFTSLNPYRIEVVGRTKHFINAFGEELMIDNAEKALEKACLETGAKIADYSAAPVYMKSNGQGAHEWIIEFTEEPDDLNRFRKKLDEELKKLNSDYEAKRHKGMALTEPIIHVGRHRLFYDWLKMKDKLGGQHKVPRLSNNRDVIDELLEINIT